MGNISHMQDWRNDLIDLKAKIAAMRERHKANPLLSNAPSSASTQSNTDTRTYSTTTPKPTPPANGDPACPHCHGIGWFRRDVEVGHPDFGILVSCACLQEKQRQRMLDEAQKASNLTRRMLSQTFDAFQPRDNWQQIALQECQRFAREPEGWIILSGDKGQGKTHLMAAVAHALFAHERKPLYVVVPDWLDYMRAGFRASGPTGPNDTVHEQDNGDSTDERMRQAKEVDVLLLDDLGAEKRSAWSDQVLYQLLNFRYNEEKPTIISTNCSMEPGASGIEARILSRMRDRALSHIIPLYGPDYRESNDRASQRGDGGVA